MRMADCPHVSQRELDATVVAGRPQPLIGTDAGEGPVKQRPRAIDADNLPGPATEQVREEPA
jgi:hypothetical protein